MSPIHGTSQLPAEPQRKDEVWELTIKTVNIIKQRIKHKEIKVYKVDEYDTNITKEEESKIMCQINKL